MNNINEKNIENVDELKCGICFEILVDPTTLTCGHTVCRYCLGQWWYKSKRSTCPECRQVWHGFPKVNVTLRNTMDLLFKKEVLKRRNTLSEDPNYKKILDKFERHKNQHHHFDNSQGVSCTLICILVALSVLVAVAYGGSVGSLLYKLSPQHVIRELREWVEPDTLNLIAIYFIAVSFCVALVGLITLLVDGAFDVQLVLYVTKCLLVVSVLILAFTAVTSKMVERSLTHGRRRRARTRY